MNLDSAYHETDQIAYHYPRKQSMMITHIQNLKVKEDCHYSRKQSIIIIYQDPQVKVKHLEYRRPLGELDLQRGDRDGERPATTGGLRNFIVRQCRPS